MVVIQTLEAFLSNTIQVTCEIICKMFRLNTLYNSINLCICSIYPYYLFPTDVFPPIIKTFPEMMWF